MLPESLDSNLLVTIAAVFLAIISAFICFRIISQQGRANQRWKDKSIELDNKIGRYDAIFGAYPGLILVWEETTEQSQKDWGDPQLYGSPAALASMMRFAEAGKAKDLARRVLNGIADLDTVSETLNSQTLRHYLAKLRQKGEPFSISIILPQGNVLEADGRVAGRQVVLWLEDASIRGEDERLAISRFETNRMTAEIDPVAFIEMMNRSPFPMWRVNGAGNLTWANAAYIKAVEASDIFEVLKSQIHLDDNAAQEAQAVLAHNQRHDAERNIIIEGENRPTALTIFPINGGVAGMAMDASEGVALRDQLQSHRRAHDNLLGNMHDALVIFGPNQILRYHNQAFETLFKIETGWLNDGVSHGDWLDYMRQRDLLPLNADYHEWKREELGYYTEWPNEVPADLWELPDGRILRLIRLRDAQDGISLLFSDMTDAMTLKGQLGTLIKVQGATLDKLSDAITVFGADGRLKLHNASFAQMWNINEADLKDNPRFSQIIDLSRPLYHDIDFWNDLKARVSDPDPDIRRQVEGEIRRSNDTMLTWLSKPLPDGATLIAWNDVTNARRAEAALIERAEAMEETDRMKSEFVGHVSYQLRTPLTTISGYADFLQNGGAGEMNDKQSEYVFAIQSASEDLEKIINDILDIAAIEANVLDLDLGDVDIFDMLDQALNYVATKADDTKISLDLKCPEDIGVIRADATRLKQVVHNLLSNALRFTKPNGRIILSGARAPSGGVKISVKDDGVGIPSERQGQVFDSFESSRGGAGLGLALVQRFVERHGGWVELESVEGEGTHVTCYLPDQASIDGAHPELFSA